MIQLPPAIDPWRSLLALLPPALAASLGPSIERLVLALGPLRAARARPGGEPDGFSGIARRGSYERLLLSEWLLADEMPDEFARRATMGEHSFHALARRSPTHAATSVALFDAGPDQLGSPRIAHLVALIALAGRAERAGARFTWGLLHEPGVLIAAVTAESALRLVAGRSALVVDDETLRAWSAYAKKEAWEDVWIVGRGALSRQVGATWAPASIEAHDVLDPSLRAVRVVVSVPPAPPREIDLDLPDERTCARLLRDPFVRAQTPPRVASADAVATSNLLFSSNGAKVFARGRGGEILAYPVPLSLTAHAGRPKRYMPRSRGVVVAVAWYHRGLVMLIAGERELRIELTNGNHLEGFRAPIPLPEGLGFAAPTLTDPLAPLVLKAHGSRVVPITFDAKRALYAMSPSFDPPLARVAPEVSALCFARDQVAFVGRDVNGDATLGGVALGVVEDSGPLAIASWRLFVVGPSALARAPVPLRGDGSFAAIYGFAEGGDPAVVLVAVQQHASTWTIHGAKAQVTLHPPSGARVVGVFSSAPDSGPELIVLESDQRVLSFVGQTTSRSLPRASAAIQHVAQCTSRSTLAYVTVAGEVVIHSLIHERPLARYLPKEGS